MDGDKVDVEKLINEIESRPALWNMRERGYSDRNLKRKCWEEIINLFAHEDSTIEEKKMLGDQLHKKWKNIRDNFARYIQGRKGKSGAGSRQKAPYIYSQRLQFLVDVIGPKKTTNSLEPTETVDNELRFPELDNNRPETSTPVLTTNIRSKICRKRLNPVEDRILSSLENYEKRANRPVVEDDNHHFLISLVPSLASLPRRLNTNCRLEIMQIISKYEIIASQSNSIAPLPTLHQISQNVPIQQQTYSTLPPAPSSSQSFVSYSHPPQQSQFDQTLSNVSTQQYTTLPSAPSPAASASSSVSNCLYDDDSQFSVF